MTSYGVCRNALAIFLAVFLAGCTADYYARRDVAHSSSGEAVAQNAMVHIIDPWPANAGNRRIPGDGRRLSGAVERYKENEADSEDSGDGGTTISIEGITTGGE